jgi:hypothetical protein
MNRSARALDGFTASCAENNDSNGHLKRLKIKELSRSVIIMENQQGKTEM